jgi:transcriptional regulator PpsR
MDANAALSLKSRPFTRGLLGGLDAAVAEKVVAAGGDVAMVIDRDGVICDLAVANEAIAKDGAGSWLDRRWSDTVTIDSKNKVVELLRDAAQNAPARWREINQVTPSQKSLMIRYMAVDSGHEGRVIAIGRDERATAAMQQRLIEAQQALERDFTRTRDAEFRYRLLFQVSSEAVLIVDGSSRRISEANPAAEALIGARGSLIGEPFSRIFGAKSQEEAIALLTLAQSATRPDAPAARLLGAHREFLVSASVFRQDRASQYLVRLTPAENRSSADQAGPDLHAIIERIPEAFLVTDDALSILTANSAFLDLAQIGTLEQATGQSIGHFLGRVGMERNILVDNLRAHGSVKNFATLFRNQFGDQEDVEVSAVSVPGPQVHFGFTIRTLTRRQADRAQPSPDLRNSVAQLTELVGRVSLKELVRETTDLVERLCIEAALELSKDNRASAAEILGLSRQSLYAKLHRFNLGNLGSSDASDLI